MEDSEFETKLNECRSFKEVASLILEYAKKHKIRIKEIELKRK
jgi:hypothetical protein